MIFMKQTSMVGKKDKMTKEEIINYMAENAWYYRSAAFHDKIRKFDEKQALIEIEIIKRIKSGEFDWSAITEEACKKGNQILKEKANQNKIKRLAQEERNLKNGQEIKALTKPGDILKVRGTNDGRGYRLVVKIEDYKVICQKLSWKFQLKKFKKENYMTTHGWDKVFDILHTKEEVKNKELI